MLLLFTCYLHAQDRYEIEGGWITFDSLKALDSTQQMMLKDSKQLLNWCLEGKKQRLYDAISPGSQGDKDIDTICLLLAPFKGQYFKPTSVRVDHYVTNCFMHATDTCILSELEFAYRFPNGMRLVISYEDYGKSRHFSYQNYDWHFYGIELERKNNYSYAASYNFSRKKK